MCESDLYLKDLVQEKYSSGEFIPLKKWSKNLPQDVWIEEETRNIKTGGEIREVDKEVLVSDQGRIREGWKFDWIPKEMKVEGDYLWCKIPSGKLGLYHFSSSNTSFFTVCNEKIEYEKEVLQALGLLEGEMIRSKSGKSRQYLSFSNMKPELVNIVVKGLEEIGISKKRLRVQPIVNTKNVSCKDEEIVSHWIEQTVLNRDNFVSVYTDSRYQTEADYGSVNLKCYDTVMREVLEFILNTTKLLENRETAKYFLQGLFAAEGSVNLSPQNRLNNISLGVKEEKLCKEYRKMLELLDISPGGRVEPVSKKKAQEKGWSRGTGGYFMIQGTPNFRKLLKAGVWELYPKKNIEMLIGLDNRKTLSEEFDQKVSSSLESAIENNPHIYEKISEKIMKLTDRDKEVLSILRRLEEADRQKMAEKLEINPSSASRRMRALYEKGKVKRKTEGRRIIWTPRQDF